MLFHTFQLQILLLYKSGSNFKSSAAVSRISDGKNPGYPAPESGIIMKTGANHMPLLGHVSAEP